MDRLANKNSPYARNLQKLVSSAIANVWTDSAMKVLDVVFWNSTETEVRREYAGDLWFEINYFRWLVSKLWIWSDDVRADFNSVLGKKLFSEFWFIPEAWKDSVSLKDRYNTLISVIRNEKLPSDWWANWQSRINLLDNSIMIDWVRFSLNDEMIPNSLEWDVIAFDQFISTSHGSLIEVLPSLTDLQLVWKFVNSTWSDELKKDLMHFMWFSDWDYWTDREWGYLSPEMAYFYNVSDARYSYSPRTQKKHVHTVFQDAK